MSYPAHFVVPGSLTQRTGGYRYNAAVIQGLTEKGWLIGVHELPGDTWPMLSRPDRAECARILDTLPDDSLIVLDGLAISGLLEVLPELTARTRVMALVHCPLFRETGISPALKARFLEEETHALSLVQRVVATSTWAGGDVVRSFGVPRGKLGVVEPGVAPAPPAVGSDGKRLLCVASLTQRKGQLVLLQALGQLKAIPWELHLVGSPDRDPGYAARVRAAIQKYDLSDRVTLTGELAGEALDRAYHEADVFVLPSWYETYGMVFTEALARGLPVVTTRAGAVPSTVPEAARLIVEPGDAEGLATELERVLTDHHLRAQLADAAAELRRQLPTWDAAVHGFARELALLQRGS